MLDLIKNCVNTEKSELISNILEILLYSIIIFIFVYAVILIIQGIRGFKSNYIYSILKLFGGIIILIFYLYGFFVENKSE